MKIRKPNVPKQLYVKFLTQAKKQLFEFLKKILKTF